MEAADYGHQSVVEVLVKAGASLDMQNEVGIVYSIGLCDSCK